MRLWIILGILFWVWAGTVPVVAAQRQNSYAGKAQTELDHWGAKIQNLQTRTQRIGAQNRDELDRQLKQLNEKFQAAQDKLSDLKSSTGNRWKKIRPEVDGALADVRRAYRKTLAYFQKSQKEKD